MKEKKKEWERLGSKQFYANKNYLLVLKSILVSFLLLKKETKEVLETNKWLSEGK